MDGIRSAVLNKLFALGDAGRYFVLSEEDFFEAFPEDCPHDGGELKKAIEELAAEGYLDVKYSGGNMYCTALLREPCGEPDGIAPEENDGLDDIYEPEEKKSTNMSAFWGAFAGGAAGSAIISLIWLLINLC